MHAISKKEMKRLVMLVTCHTFRTALAQPTLDGS
jgi:hypothetical protein